MPLLKSRQAHSPIFMRIVFLRAFALLAFSFMVCAEIHAETVYATDLKGKPVRELGGAGVRVVVLIFASSDCPISNRYIPEIARLDHEFASQRVRIWWVFPNAEDTAGIVTKHVQEFGIKELTLIDTKQSLVHMAHATVTPDAAVFKVDGAGLSEIYHGRIDDRYLSIGTERPQAGHHDLEIAIASTLAREPVARSAETPVGCAIIPLDPATK